MAFPAQATISVRGRELGIQVMSTSQTGSGRGGVTSFVVGSVADIRTEVTTAETTSANLRAHGLSPLNTGSSAVMTLDPPIPGILKTLYSSGGATAFVKTANSETLESSAGTTFTVMRFIQGGAVVLRGLTTARWLFFGSTAVAALTTTT